MSDDLIKRLLNAPADGLGTEDLCAEAADRIEQLERDKVLDDGRPCVTDVFLAAAIEQLDDKWDFFEAVKCWCEGDWEGALEGIELDGNEMSDDLDELTKAEQRGYANAMEAERKLHENRIEELVEENKELTLQLLATHGQAADSLERAVVAEAKLAKAVERLRNIRELNMTAEDENGHQWANSDLIEQEIVTVLAELEKKCTT